MRGITPRMKSDRDLREGAKTYREAQKEARGKHAEHNPEHDMGTEDTDQRNQDAVETPEPNAATHTPPYDDEEMELANEQERHHEANNPQPHQAQNPRDDDPLEGNPERMTEADTILYLVDLLQSDFSEEEAHKALASSTRKLLAIAVANVRAERVFRGLDKEDDDKEEDEEEDDDEELERVVRTQPEQHEVTEEAEEREHEREQEIETDETTQPTSHDKEDDDKEEDEEEDDDEEPERVVRTQPEQHEITEETEEREHEIEQEIETDETTQPTSHDKEDDDKEEDEEEDDDEEPERAVRTQPEQHEVTEEAEEREHEREQEIETDETTQPTSHECTGALIYDVSGRVTGKRCGHGECKMLNEPKNRICKKCKKKLPNRTATWKARGLVMRKREHDWYWAAVCYKGINGFTGTAEASVWMNMGWGMGVSPETGGAGGKGVMRKRARDKGRGTLETDIEKAGGRTGARAPRKKKQKTEQGNTSEEDTAREETNKERGTKRKLNSVSEINPTKTQKN
jgi:hypothetical protein